MEDMMRRVVTGMGVLIVVLLATSVRAHDGHATVGELVAVAGDSIQVKTAKQTVTIKLSEKTVFELKKKPVDVSSLQKGDRVSVTTSKLPSGELLATKIVMGLPKPKPSTAKSSGR
jgi:hypothetical protein